MTEERSNRNAGNASGASRKLGTASASNNPRLRAQQPSHSQGNPGVSQHGRLRQEPGASQRDRVRPSASREVGARSAPSRAAGPQQARNSSTQSHRSASPQQVRNAGAQSGHAAGASPSRARSAYQQPAGYQPVVSSSRKPEAKPVDDKRQRGGFWRVIFWAALLVFVVSASALAFIGYTYWQGQKSYDDLASEAFTVPDSNTLADFEVDWEALRAINSDVVGWIYIPGTDINYPIAWREGDDEHYLKYNFNGATSAEFGAEYGSIMLSGVNAPDYSDTVNIIYGHNMANGSMFGRLSKMHRDADEWNSHRLVYLLTPKGNYLLQTFSVVHVPGTSTDIIVPNFGTDGDRVAYMQDKIDGSIVTADPAGSPAEDIAKTFALVTCDGADRSYRYITYCEVLEFYPAGSSGDAGLGAASGSAGGDASINDGSIVDDGDLDAVGNAASDRTA